MPTVSRPMSSVGGCRPVASFRQVTHPSGQAKTAGAATAPATAPATAWRALASSRASATATTGRSIALLGMQVP